MNLFKTIIVDDEIPSTELLSYFIKKHCPRLSVEGIAHNLSEAEIIIKQNEPDILFLDIQINDQVIFDMLNKVGDLKNFQIIFVTAFDEYAVKAIKIDAIDYLLKPIDINSLKIAVDKAILNIKNKVTFNKLSYSKFETSMKDFLYNRDKKIAISSQNEIVFVHESEILFLTSHRKYSVINLKNGKELVSSKNIGEFEKVLTPENFFRIHHSHIINLNYLKKIKSGYCELANGALLQMSIRKGKELKNFMKF